ncbi:type II restriction endonuclease TdeIII [Laceyella sediminis]|jgi:hypothetical protein|uniref:type II site-specific deoxyribonuclease n=1 Tax=Laceyella sediminis TaxID=573074 RepID=A0ABX5EL12_9BACL|nr:TdeIII family type II restriction endonuclease [Laceyella sediminis]PRZ12619.1 type II restriction endonuclease TdeIII [Laceyella sediminis]
MDSSTKNRIKEHISSVLESLITKRVNDEPFNENEIREKNPFGYLLVPIEVWKGAKFERSFVTTLGQNIFEQIGKIIAEGTGAYAINQYKRHLTLNTHQTDKINMIIENQRKKKEKGVQPNIEMEINDLKNISINRTENFTIVSDLYIRRPNGHEEFYSFKTVKPNKDQTAEAKRNLLILRTAFPNCEAFFALPYNPAGEGKMYRKSKHSVPYSFFDMDDDRFVLIGSTLWNKIGNNSNTYNELLQIFEEVGQDYWKRIRREYFGMQI